MGWESGNDLGFKFLSVADDPARWFKAIESVPSHSARLYITYDESTPPTSDDTEIENYRNITIWNRTIGEGYPFQMAYKSGITDRAYFLGWDDSGVQFNTSPAIAFKTSMQSTMNDIVKWVGSDQYFVIVNNTDLNLCRSNDSFVTVEIVESLVTTGTTIYGLDMEYSEASGYLHIIYGVGVNLYYHNYSVPTGTLSSRYTIVTEATAINSADMVVIREDSRDKLYVAMAHENAERFTFQQKINDTWSNQYSEDSGITQVGNLKMDYCVDYDTFVVSRLLSSGGNDRIYFTNKTRYSAFGNWQLIGAWDEITPWDDKASDYSMVMDSDNNVIIVIYASLDDNKRVGISTASAPSFVWTEHPYSTSANFSGDVRHPIARTSPERNQIWVSVYDVNNWNFYDAPYTFYDSEHTVLQLASRKVQDIPTLTFWYWGSKHYEGTQSFRIVAYDNGTLINNTCMDNAYNRYLNGDTNYLEYLEEVKACIDDYLLGDDPQNPNPPGSNYPDSGPFTRFRLRWGIFFIGLLLIFGPLMLMAYKTFGVHWYFIFPVIMLLGLGLLWSVGSI